MPSFPVHPRVYPLLHLEQKAMQNLTFSKTYLSPDLRGEISPRKEQMMYTSQGKKQKHKAPTQFAVITIFFVFKYRPGKKKKDC